MVATNALRASSARRRSESLESGCIPGPPGFWGPLIKGGDGTTMAVCRKSSDATNVRWASCDPDQGPGRDNSLGYLIASGIFVASYRAVPVASRFRDSRCHSQAPSPALRGDRRTLRSAGSARDRDLSGLEEEAGEPPPPPRLPAPCRSAGRPATATRTGT